MTSVFICDSWLFIAVFFKRGDIFFSCTILVYDKIRCNINKFKIKITTNFTLITEKGNSFFLLRTYFIQIVIWLFIKHLRI